MIKEYHNCNAVKSLTPENADDVDADGADDVDGVRRTICTLPVPPIGWDGEAGLVGSGASP